MLPVPIGSPRFMKTVGRRKRPAISLKSEYGPVLVGVKPGRDDDS